jgi:hypothetical protein
MTAAATPDVTTENSVRNYTVLEQLGLGGLLERYLQDRIDPDTLTNVIAALGATADHVVYDHLDRLEARNATHAMRTVARSGMVEGTEDEMQFVAISDKGWQQAPVRVNHTATVTVG